MIKPYLGISRREFLLKFFDLWNVLQKEEVRLTSKEIAILTEFLLLPDKFKYSKILHRLGNMFLELLTSLDGPLTRVSTAY